MTDSKQLSGKRILVVGGATGMGAAVAKMALDQGGEVTVLDVAEIDYAADFHQVDLRNKDNISSVIAAMQGNFDIVHACAGVADGTPGIMLINFVSQRYLIDSLVNGGRINKGGAIVMISSVAGLPWQMNIAQVTEFLGKADWEEAVAWIGEHEGTDSYTFSKQAVNAYVASMAYPFLQKGVRINAVMPGPTDTPLARANAEQWLGFGQAYRDAAGVGALTPEQIGQTMTFLASENASGINGISLLVDHGQIASAIADSYPEPVVRMMLGIG